MSNLRHSLHSRIHHRRHLQANENGIRAPRFSDLQKSTPTHHDDDDDDGGGGDGGCGDDDNTTTNTTTAAAAAAAAAAATSTERIFP